MMNKYLLSGIALAFGASVAQAADPAPADWTGIYLGVHGGFGGGTFDYPMQITGGTPPLDDYRFGAELTSSGFFGGLQAGWNWQAADQLVLGIEGDISKSDIKGDFSLYSKTANATIDAGSTVDWYGTVRARAGFLATPDLLIYGTGGIAWGSVDAQYDLSDLFGPGAEDSTSTDHMGWAVGGGLEYAVTDRLSIKTEYLYVDLGKEKLLDAANVFGTPLDLKINQDISFHTIQAGLNFRF